MLSTTIELRRMVVAMYEEQFSKRLTELRTQKGVSARDMSLSIGHLGDRRVLQRGRDFVGLHVVISKENLVGRKFFQLF